MARNELRCRIRNDALLHCPASATRACGQKNEGSDDATDNGLSLVFILLVDWRGWGRMSGRNSDNWADSYCYGSDNANDRFLHGDYYLTDSFRE